MKEFWKAITGFEGQYEVSTKGRVRSLYRLVKGKCGTTHYRKGQILTPQTGSSYAQVYLRVGDKQKWFYVHRLVAEAFIPNVENKPMINHKDENKLNNAVENLEWCDARYNLTYGNGVEKRAEARKRNFQKKLDDMGLTREEYKQKQYEKYYARNRERLIQLALDRYYKNKDKYLS